MYGRDLIIEKDDAKTIVEGERITLMNWGNCTITRIETSADGGLALFGTIDEADKDYKKTKKLTWLLHDPATICEIEMMEYDHLITKPKLEAGDEAADFFNNDSKVSYMAYAEGCVRNLAKGSYF